MQLINLELIPELDFKSNEAYKSLRTNIQFCGSNVKTICFTSSVPNEGKSSVSFRLALSFAENGKRVVFIDADLRRSVIIGRYRPDQGVLGLSHYLSGQKTLDDVLYETNITNLDCIFAGPVPPNPSELLDSEFFSNLLSFLRDEYDYIIIDSPPIGSVIDGVIISKRCDGTILVVESHGVSIKLVQKVKKQLEQVESKILGAVLNKADKKSSEYWGYQRKYKKYQMNYYTAEE